MTGVLAVVVPVSGQMINEDAKLLAIDGVAGDRFGTSVAVDNGIIAVGSPQQPSNGLYAGSAYVFDALTGVQIAKLIPNDGAADDEFGISIAIDNGIVAVGAFLNDANGTNSGSAYLFDLSTGIQIAKLLPNDGPAGAGFGRSIAIGNGIVAVGAVSGFNANGVRSGSAYLFDVSTGVQIVKLIPTDSAENDFFGYSIAIDNDIVAIGAISGFNANGVRSGSAYVFSASTGTQIAKLLPSDGTKRDFFGWSIAIDNGVIIVGAPLSAGTGNGRNSGSAYLYDASTGSQIAELIPTDGAVGDQFGWSCAIFNGIVAVGAVSNDDNGTNSGSAYLFIASTGVQLAKILPSDGASGDNFGNSTAIANGIMAIGAKWDSDNGSLSGSAYMFDISGCNADFTGDGALDVLDFFAFITAFGANDMAADLDGSGAIDVLDFFAFITFFALGCP